MTERWADVLDAVRGGEARFPPLMWPCTGALACAVAHIWLEGAAWLWWLVCCLCAAGTVLLLLPRRHRLSGRHQPSSVDDTRLARASPVRRPTLRVTVAAVLLGGLMTAASCAVDAGMRAHAMALVRPAAQELELRLSDDANATDRTVIADAVITAGPAAGATITVFFPSAVAAATLTRGTHWRGWMKVAAAKRRGPAAVQASVVSQATADPVRPDTPLTRQRAALTALGKVWGGDAGALVPGMIAGDRSLQSQDLEATMKISGLSHLTAVSGANVAMLLSGVAALLRRCRVRPRAQWPLLVGAVVVFVGLVGPDPSVLRAGITGGLAALAVTLGRPGAAMALLLASVTVLVALDPWQLTRVAFQLSVLATAGILLLSGPLAALLQALRAPRPMAEAIAVSTAASIACLPVLVGLSPQQSLGVIPVNVLAAPCAAVVGIVGPALLAVAPLGLPWVWPLLALCAWPAQCVASLGSLTAAEAPMVPWPEGPGGPLLAGILCWAAPAAVLVSVKRRRKNVPRPGSARSRWRSGLASPRRGSGLAPARPPRRRGSPRPAPKPRRPRSCDRPTRLPSRRATLAVLALGCAAALLGSLAGGFGRPAAQAAQDGDLFFCDVGQGDATVLVGDAGRGILIDAGPEPATVDRCLRKAGVTAFCAVIVTHLHADHSGGLPGALEGRTSDATYYGTAGRASPTPGAIRAEGGETAECGHWHLTVVAAPRGAAENDASLVVRATSTAAGDRPALDLLAAGDLEADAAAQFTRTSQAAQPQDPEATRVLKVSHHGAKNGGTALEEAFRPDIALIGVGQGNDYGHPAQQIVDALQRGRARVWRTDKDKSVLVHPERGNVRVWRSQ